MPFPCYDTCCSTMRVKATAKFLQVKDWGTGKPQDIGNLQVQSFQPGTKQAQQKDLAFYVRLTWGIVNLKVNAQRMCHSNCSRYHHSCIQDKISI